MPFQETCVDEQKLRFIAEWLSGEWSMTGLCDRFGITRAWGHELVRRYRAGGYKGLQARSRAPHRHGRAMAQEAKSRILALRRARPSWGPKKLRAYLCRQHAAMAWPALSTIGDLLKREGLVEARRRQRRPIALTQPFGPVQASNDLWCIDFKGWFRTRDGRRCDPLTLSDAHSRFLLDCRIVAPSDDGVRPVVDRAFRAYGLPAAIRSDNGPPFASATAAAGLTRLAVHWIKLGIRLERIDPGQPQQNGRHERMHATLQLDGVLPPAANAATQQRRFNHFRQDFNTVRPHEALAFEVPASLYRPSPRGYPERIVEPQYAPHYAVRRVRSNGEIKWMGDTVFISEALVGEPVGIAEIETGDWIVRFADLPLGIINRNTRTLHRFTAARPGRREARKQTRKTVNDLSGP
jgi:transposase InsO family protein